MGSTAEGTSLEGRNLGRYRVLRLVGRGGTADVYEASRFDDGAHVALKVLHTPVQSEALDRFEREVLAATLVRHPHVVEVVESGIAEGRPFLAMEYLEGDTLEQLIRCDGRLAPERLVSLMLPIVSAISAVHELGVVHGDLKPENVFLARSSRDRVVPKVLDFGASRVVLGSSSSRVSMLPHSAMLAGTPAYMAPEAARGERVDSRSDQYGLGVILYVGVTGRLPHDAITTAELVQEIARGSFRPPRTLVRELPKSLDASIVRAMANRPADRFPSVSALGEALLGFASPAARRYFEQELDTRRFSVPAPESYPVPSRFVVANADEERDVIGSTIPAPPGFETR